MIRARTVELPRAFGVAPLHVSENDIDGSDVECFASYVSHMAYGGFAEDHRVVTVPSTQPQHWISPQKYQHVPRLRTGPAYLFFPVINFNPNFGLS
jgi:hypothetical protein